MTKQREYYSWDKLFYKCIAYILGIGIQWMAFAVIAVPPLVPGVQVINLIMVWLLIFNETTNYQELPMQLSGFPQNDSMVKKFQADGELWMREFFTGYTTAVKNWYKQWLLLLGLSSPGITD